MGGGQGRQWSEIRSAANPDSEIQVSYHDAIDSQEASADLRALFVDKTMSLEAYRAKYPEADIFGYKP